MIARLLKSVPSLQNNIIQALKVSFCGQGDKENTYGVKFDEEQIKRKIQELK